MEREIDSVGHASHIKLERKMMLIAFHHKIVIEQFHKMETRDHDISNHQRVH